MNDANETAATPEQVGTYTASALQVRGSSFVLQVVFSDIEITPPTGPAGGTVREVPRMIVGIPWPLAKVLHHVLGANLKVYEESLDNKSLGVPKLVADQLQLPPSPPVK